MEKSSRTTLHYIMQKDGAHDLVLLPPEPKKELAIMIIVLNALLVLEGSVSTCLEY